MLQIGDLRRRLLELSRRFEHQLGAHRILQQLGQRTAGFSGELLRLVQEILGESYGRSLHMSNMRTDISYVKHAQASPRRIYRGTGISAVMRRVSS